ncbi:MAG: GatB/YqeY domain-containing protein [Campylobacterales bacterium]|nr:GatB/YqeY domain-containing protein [Campylobacterales bacterium]
MNLKEQLKADLKDAMRAKELVKRDTIRSINTMIKQIEVDERKDLNDDDVIKLIQKGIKQREEAISQYQEAKRDDLVEVEASQIEIFKLYLPKQLTDEELEVLTSEVIAEVAAQSMKDMGKVMPVLKTKVGSSADGKRMSGMIKKLLG